ncbi:hypothetical protein PF005_g23140 [Phytophthora fragariae]|uniref:Uncharacterized protein n=1 Tax=Phytophthora fragariae TaxID=53985 RepID=A0A6A4C5M4_9STRA|nr:hypothetical protein PF003_g11302 [Phytophthora fragariae]KAE8925900.1 hypothetical protein PF009_g23897 [Phytophthora fragariae]KAE9078681.1 hypothetical protein PF007_g23748 [Phytophthora fragariae]KAE9105540.1 hypothetical protein PF006_g21617 [Phytophthora fragariae]KAE9180770.1 hypothetical protein PF005_g23140 [Phytophthora fragariae]
MACSPWSRLPLPASPLSCLPPLLAPKSRAPAVRHQARWVLASICRGRCHYTGVWGGVPWRSLRSRHYAARHGQSSRPGHRACSVIVAFLIKRPLYDHHVTCPVALHAGR